MNYRLRTGEALGRSIMKFALTYQGELRANDDYRRKWEIRNYFAPQLEELWHINPALQETFRNRWVPAGEFLHAETHHSLQGGLGGLSRPVPGPAIDLCADIDVGGRAFFPLVRDTYALQCGLKINFLRKEDPGRIYQGGDLDNRLKTLFDALSIPDAQQIDKSDKSEGRIYCLIENDRLISSLSVDTHRLLAAPGMSKHHVQLLIEVDVKVTQPRAYNQAFLGD